MSYLYQKAEQYIRDIYWAQTHDKQCTLNIPQIVAEKLIEDNLNKDPEYYNHRAGIVHVSYLSKCLRGVLLEMMGAPKDEQDPQKAARKLGVFKAGNLFEDYIVNALGKRMLDRQTEYIFKFGSIILTGRDDGTILHEGKRRVLEAKSVHSDSFWHRQQEGTLVATHNQMQLQTYLWLRRLCPDVYFNEVSGDYLYTNLTPDELMAHGKHADWAAIEHPDNNDLNGIFSYISKDDCTVVSAPVKYNPNIIEETVMPVLKIISAAYEAKLPLIQKRDELKAKIMELEKRANENSGDGADIFECGDCEAELGIVLKQLYDVSFLPAPDLVVYDAAKGQWTKNWLCTYNDYASLSYGAGWLLEAGNLVMAKNKELRRQTAASFGAAYPKEKPQIAVVGKVEPTAENKLF